LVVRDILGGNQRAARKSSSEIWAQDAGVMTAQSVHGLPFIPKLKAALPSFLGSLQRFFKTPKSQINVRQVLIDRSELFIFLTAFDAIRAANRSESLSLQLPFFEMCALSDCLVSSTPE
jgi:hypothetical protein